MYGPDHLGVRRLSALVTNLPAESAFARSRDGAAKAGWTHTDEMLATLVNAAVFHRYEWLLSRGVEVDPPEPVVSPWAPPPAPPALNTGTDLAEFLAAPITYAAGSAS